MKLKPLVGQKKNLLKKILFQKLRSESLGEQLDQQNHLKIIVFWVYYSMCFVLIIFMVQF